LYVYLINPSDYSLPATCTATSTLLLIINIETLSLLDLLIPAHPTLIYRYLHILRLFKVEMIESPPDNSPDGEEPCETMEEHLLSL
jgi:hypothetical protein